MQYDRIHSTDDYMEIVKILKEERKLRNLRVPESENLLHLYWCYGYRGGMNRNFIFPTRYPYDTKNEIAIMAAILNDYEDIIMDLIFPNDRNVLLKSVKFSITNQLTRMVRFLFDYLYPEEINSLSYYACELGNIEIILLFILNNTNINLIYNEIYNTLFEVLCARKIDQKDIINLLKLLLEKGVTTNLERTLLTSIKNNNIEVFKFLLSIIKDNRQIDVHRDVFDECFNEACNNDNLDVVRILLPYIQINKLTQNGFDYAIKSNFVDILEYVLPMKLFDITNSLIICTMNKIPKSTMQLLLDIGAPTDIRDDEGLTPLMIATLRRNYEQVELLVFYIDVNAQSITGDTALHYSIAFGYINTKIFDLLVELTNINIANNYGYTPFLLVSKFGMLKLIMLVAEKFPDINATNNAGENALHLVLRNIRPSRKVVDFLIRLGVHTDTPDKSGIMPLHLLLHAQLVDY